MNNNAYLSYTPKTEQYTKINSGQKVKSFDDQLGCGDCLRGGFIYCTQSAGMGSSYTEGAPEGKCCRNSADCAE